MEPAGPGAEGFNIHVLTDGDRVLINFGVPVTHIPMPADVAEALAGTIYNNCRRLSQLAVITALPDLLSVCRHDGGVLLETKVAVDHLRLTPAECLALCLSLMDVVSRIRGKASPCLSPN